MMEEGNDGLVVELEARSRLAGQHSCWCISDGEQAASLMRGGRIV
jgi:hypothetical protein